MPRKLTLSVSVSATMSKVMSTTSRASLKGPEDDEWVPGCRYAALQAFPLHLQPDASTDAAIGTIRAKEDALLLDLQRNEREPSLSVTPTGSKEAVYGFVASTKRPEWTYGWAQLGGSSSSTKPVLGKTRQRGSWEIGGRYAVQGDPLLRAEKQLDSKQLGEVHKDEEVLVLEVALVISEDEPRLRGRVRTDKGLIGWLTVELPFSPPLLRPGNLYGRCSSKVGLPVSTRVSNGSGSSARLTPDGAEEGWTVGGQYRLVKNADLYADPDFTNKSQKICQLKQGTLLEVHEKMLSGETQEHLLHLRVSTFQDSDSPQVMSGWISPWKVSGKAVLDSRDQTEYDKVVLFLKENPCADRQEVQEAHGIGSSVLSREDADCEEEVLSEVAARSDTTDFNPANPHAPSKGGPYAYIVASPQPGNNAICPSLAPEQQSDMASPTATKLINGSTQHCDHNNCASGSLPNVKEHMGSQGDNDVVIDSPIDESFASCWLSCAPCNCYGANGRGMTEHVVRTRGDAPHYLPNGSTGHDLPAAPQ